MKIQLLKIALIMLAAATFGCASATQTITGHTRPPLPASAVKIYETTPANAEIIGTVNVSNMNGYDHSLLHPEKNLMVKQAAKMGANGLVVGPSDTTPFVGYKASGQAIYVPQSN